MVDVCDMTNFPVGTIFNQVEIPEEIPPNYDYEYTRFFAIRASGSAPSGMIEKFEVTLVETPTSPINPGVPKHISPWEDVIEKELSAPPFVGRTPLDFQLWKESRVALYLEQGFWSFSSNLSALTTKHDYSGQYFDLRRHIIVNSQLISVTDAEWRQKWTAYPSRCISLYTKEPCRDWQLGGGNPKIEHGFSLNLDIPMGGKKLPITIDPDIENKGGHP